jgi:hypothetical protein
VRLERLGQFKNPMTSISAMSKVAVVMMKMLVTVIYFEVKQSWSGQCFHGREFS